MKSLKIPMTIEEFETAEFPFGWKDEYCDGFAYLTPREHGILMKIPVEKRRVANVAVIKPIDSASVGQLSELFYAAFVESVEFCDYTKSEIKRLARKNVKSFFDGKRGIPALELSRVAILPRAENSLVGACLVSRYKYGYKNEILFVRPEMQKNGVGTALVAAVMNDLSDADEKIFWSERHICNEASGAWHEKFGFVEEPDIMTAKFRRNYLRRKLWHHEKLANTEKTKEIKLLLWRAEIEVERLQAIEEVDFGAAWLAWKYDF